MNRAKIQSALLVLLLGLAPGCGGTTTGNPTVDTSASEIAESFAQRRGQLDRT